MGKHKNDSGSSDDVIGHLDFVLSYRLDLSKRLIDKLDVKISSINSKFLKFSSNYCILSSLTNQLSPRLFKTIVRAVARYAELGVVKAKDIKDHQKMLSDRAISLGSLKSPCSSNALFELFTCVEHFIEYCEEIEQLIDDYEEAINVMLSRNMNMVPSLDGNDMNMMREVSVLIQMQTGMKKKTKKMKEETMTFSSKTRCDHPYVL